MIKQITKKIKAALQEVSWSELSTNKRVKDMWQIFMEKRQWVPFVIKYNFFDIQAKSVFGQFFIMFYQTVVISIKHKYLLMSFVLYFLPL